MSSINRGDVVKLKSGSMEMTVGTIYGDETVKCFWYVGDKIEEKVIDLAALQVARPTSR